MAEKELAPRMRALADSGHPRAAELRERADKLDASVAAEPFDAKKMLGSWAKARLLWRDCTGEPLV